MLNPVTFLFIAGGVLVISLFYYFIWPHPKNVKLQKAELGKSHRERVALLENAIEVAKKHRSSGVKVYGGAQAWAQAERHELDLQDKLNQEHCGYNERIKNLEKFPLTNALVIISIFLTLIGLYLTSLGG